MLLGDVARVIAPPSGAPRLRQAKVTSIAADGTVGLLLAGATQPVAGIRYAAGVHPRIGSAVWVLGRPPDMWVVASLSNVPAPCCTVRRTNNQGSTPGDPTTVDFNTAVHDPWGMWSPTTTPGRITIPLPGIYTAVGSVAWANGNGRREASVRLNSQDRATTNTGTPPAVGGAFLSVATPPLECEAGDYFNLVGVQGSGGNLAMIGGTADRLVLGVAYQGPR